VTKIFKGKHWKEILRKKNVWFRSHYWVFSSFTPSAYHFFIPAFVIKSVTDGDKIDLVPDWIVYNFMPPRPEYIKVLTPIYIARMAKFNLKQKRVLINFLKFLKKDCSRGGFHDECINEAISALKK